MATTTYKVLGQAVLAALGTWVDLYTVPASTQAVVSTLAVVNRGTTSGQVRIAVRPGGAALANQHYLAYDATVDPSDLLALTIGITLGGGDVISLYSANITTLSASLFGSEIS